MGVAVGDAFGTGLFHKGRDWVQEKRRVLGKHFEEDYIDNVVVNKNDDSIWSYRGV